MSKDLIRYDLLVQDALKGVVRKVLGDAAREGLPGDHHFYISFRTDFPGVRISPRLREKYPEDMTIVLQHQFWEDRKSTRLNSSHANISYAVFCLKKKINELQPSPTFGSRILCNV